MENKLDYLIMYLAKENEGNFFLNIIKNDIKNINNLSREEKKKIYKALSNIREPQPLDKDFVKIQDEYLQEELKKKKITDVRDINTIGNSKICLWQGDMASLKIDCVVNPANSKGLGCFNPYHRCLDNLLGVNAGNQLRNECDEIMKKKDYNLKTSDTIITKGYNLPCKYIIHTVGPIIEREVKDYQKIELAKCYINVLNLAKEKNIKTIAFPCISTGVFAFPKELAAQIAISTVKEYLKENARYFEKIVFNVYTQEDKNYYEKLLEN